MYIVMQLISKSQLKAQLLEYLRILEKDKKPLIITHGGKPVAKITAYKEDQEEVLLSLRGSVIFYKDPTKPVGDKSWEVLQWLFWIHIF